MISFLMLGAIIFVVYAFIKSEKNNKAIVRKFENLAKINEFEIFFKVAIKGGIVGLDEKERAMAIFFKNDSDRIHVLWAHAVKKTKLKYHTDGNKKVSRIEILTNDVRNPIINLEFFNEKDGEDIYHRIAILFNLS